MDISAALADQMLSQRAMERLGEEVLVLIEDGQAGEGRAAHQGPEVDGTTRFTAAGVPTDSFAVGSYIRGEVIGSDGADLVAQAR